MADRGLGSRVEKWISEAMRAVGHDNRGLTRGRSGTTGYRKS